MSEPLPARAWLTVGLLWVTACLNYLDRVMLTTMRGSLIEAIPMSDAQFGLLTSSFLWTYALLSPFTGYLADRFDRSRVIFASLLIWSFLTWLTGQARTFPELLTVRALMGLSEAAYIPAAMALIADYHRGATRSTANSVHLTGILAGTGLGGLGGWLAERHGWSFAFGFFGLFGMLYAALLWFALRAAPRSDVPGQTAPLELIKTWRDLFSTRSFAVMSVYWGIWAFGGFAVIQWLPTYLKEAYGLTQTRAGIYGSSFMPIASMTGLIIGGAWADRWTRTRPRARVYVAMLGNSLAAPGLLAIALTSSLEVTIGALLFFGLTRAWADANTMPILCMFTDPRHRATGYGFINSLACLFGGIASYTGGVLRDAHVDLRVLYEIGALFFAICAGLLVFIRAKEEETTQPSPP